MRVNEVILASIEAFDWKQLIGPVALHLFPAESILPSYFTSWLSAEHWAGR